LKRVAAVVWSSAVVLWVVVGVEVVKAMHHRARYPMAVIFAIVAGVATLGGGQVWHAGDRRSAVQILEIGRRIEREVSDSARSRS